MKPPKRGAPPPYWEIGIASNFSFLRGASHAEELAVTAARLKLSGIGFADRNTVAGVVRGYQEARDAGIAYAPGSRLVFADGSPDVFAYPRDRPGWGRLCRLLSQGNLKTVKGDCILTFEDLLEWGEGINLALLAPDGLGHAGETESVEAALRRRLQDLADAFPGAVRLAVAPRRDGLDARRFARAASLAGACRTPLMATNDVFYHDAPRRTLADVVTSIREHVTLAEAGWRLSRNAERYLKPGAEMARLFRDHPEAITETGRFFGELAFDLKSLRYEYPDEGLGLGCTPAEELRRLAYEGAAWRYPDGVPPGLFDKIEYELAIIAKLQYEPYFLTVHRIVRFARDRGILCQGRGSAANSVVCFCIGVTEVSPDRGELLFERFISSDRGEPPDIDIDFEHQRREEVIQHIYERYGRDKAALAATVITYRARSAMREVGKAFGLSGDAIAAMNGAVFGYHDDALGQRQAAAAGLSMADRTTALVLRFSTELTRFPRHLSQHVGGFVLTRGRVDEVVPILNTGMDGRTIIEWDKDDIDEIGILKIDILALGMLSALRRGFDLIEAHYGHRITLAELSLKPDDQPTYEMTQRADTLGVFQIESRAQMSMLPKLKPKQFYDFVIEVAIVRPGPIQGDMVHPYLRRRMGLEEEHYPSDELRKVLGRTLGVPLFQEQAMQIAIVAAGFTADEADKLRRAMATFKRSGKIHTFRQKMVKGMVAKGYDPDFAERCFRQIEGFGEYGFPESHAASFALLVYASAWMKCRYPDVFCAAILNAQPMGFYAPAQLVRDAREHGIEVRPVDINHSHWDQTLEAAPFDPRRIHPRHRAMAAAMRTAHAVRLGFRQVKGLSEAEMTRLVTHRGAGYDSVRDLWLRTGLSRATMERLADADAFASLGLSRRDALWAAQALDGASAAEHLPLFAGAAAGEGELQPEPDAALPSMPPGEEVFNDYRFLSLSLKAHPVSFLRQVLRAEGIIANAEMDGLRSGRRVSVSGLVLIRQRPGSARGVIFMTIEDETGIANIIVWPKFFEANRPVVLGARFVRVTGRMQSDHGVIHVVADRIEDLTPLLMQVATGGLGSGHLAPADHVRQPLRSHPPQRPGAAASGDETWIAGAAASLFEALARGDEMRHPSAGERGRGLPSSRRRAPAVPEAAAPPGHQPGVADRDARAVLPKGRNFQ
ncbi:error-prone DNA polymerase [Mangrovicella endophytica]|uniref:error-prone DNA polymerase n=1 Tax=Mangrovicella endophytica TaxID=2066697 RepID=UPI000C9E731F|nr:error-prone DNA polymerase [Mangrovicella endophytica]